jgi:hypothetical protein
MRPVIVALLALTSASGVQAQLGTSAYYGISLGSFDYEESADAFFTGFNDTADSWRVMVGYQFMEHLAVEGGWGRTSTIADSATLSAPGFPTVNVDFSTEFKSLMVRLLGVLPFDNGVTLVGGIGYADGEQQITFDISGVGRQSGDVDLGEATFYLGAQYDWDRVALRLGYEKYNFDGDVDGSEITLSFFYKL